MRLLAIIITLLLHSCASLQADTTPRNSELIVTYEGKEVHRVGSIYSSKEELTKLVNSKKEKYIIFSAEWCPPCKRLIICLKQSGHLNKVNILNLEEPWVARLFQAADLKVVPSMLVANKDGKPIKILSGTPQIVMYLLLNVNTD